MFPNDNLSQSFLQLITVLVVAKNGRSRITGILRRLFLIGVVSITINLLENKSFRCAQIHLQLHIWDIFQTYQLIVV